MQAQVWTSSVDHGYFIVWTQDHKPLYERVEFDRKFCAAVVNNITLFYKAYVLPCLLGYRDIYQCPKCNKVILETPGISDPAKAGQTQNTVDLIDSWVCYSCLVDAADIDSACDSADNYDDLPTIIY